VNLSHHPPCWHLAQTRQTTRLTLFRVPSFRKKVPSFKECSSPSSRQCPSRNSTLHDLHERPISITSPRQSSSTAAATPLHITAHTRLGLGHSRSTPASADLCSTERLTNGSHHHHAPPATSYCTVVCPVNSSASPSLSSTAALPETLDQRVASCINIRERVRGSTTVTSQWASVTLSAARTGQLRRR
jgi:hypothetical protein